MPDYRTALSNLSALSVPGTAHNYDVDAIPDALSRAQLPALLVLPGDVPDSRPFVRRGTAFESLAFTNSARTVTCIATHLLLVTPTRAGSGLRANLPPLVDLIDAYFAALGGDITLGGILLEPARVSVEPGIYSHGGVRYHGCAFRHTWLLEV